MNLKEYSESISKLAAKYPEALVVYSSDAEGNTYQQVNYAGTLGFFIGKYRGDFISLENVGEDTESYGDLVAKEPDAVCVH